MIEKISDVIKENFMEDNFYFKKKNFFFDKNIKNCFLQYLSLLSNFFHTNGNSHFLEELFLYKNFFFFGFLNLEIKDLYILENILIFFNLITFKAEIENMKEFLNFDNNFYFINNLSNLVINDNLKISKISFSIINNITSLIDDDFIDIFLKTDIIYFIKKIFVNKQKKNFLIKSILRFFINIFFSQSELKYSILKEKDIFFTLMIYFKQNFFRNLILKMFRNLFFINDDIIIAKFLFDNFFLFFEILTICTKKINSQSAFLILQILENMVEIGKNFQNQFGIDYNFVLINISNNQKVFIKFETIMDHHDHTVKIKFEEFFENYF